MCVRFFWNDVWGLAFVGFRVLGSALELSSWLIGEVGDSRVLWSCQAALQSHQLQRTTLNPNPQP